jgi:hypothetical protein
MSDYEIMELKRAYQNNFLLVFLFVLTACSTGEDQPYESPAPQHEGKTAFGQYIIIGDSLMDSSSGGEITTTASLILLEENKSVINISLAGQTMGAAEKNSVSGAVNYLTADGHSPWFPPPGSAVIVELAHNDWAGSTPSIDFYDSYVRFLSAIEKSDTVSVFCVVPVAAKWDYEGRKNSNGMTYGELREVVRGLAKTGLCNLIETSDWFTREDVYDLNIMSDGLHLAAGGHRIYKDRLIEELGKY